MGKAAEAVALGIRHKISSSLFSLFGLAGQQPAKPNSEKREVIISRC
jgi:hypothetical protein